MLMQAFVCLVGGEFFLYLIKYLVGNPHGSREHVGAQSNGK